MAGDHFYTILENERLSALEEYAYLGEGVACYVQPLRVPGTTALYRLSHPVSGDHFYTTSTVERQSAIANAGYRDEGVACFVSPNAAAQMTPLFRLFNPTNGDHFYTTSAAERDAAVQGASSGGTIILPGGGSTPIAGSGLPSPLAPPGGQYVDEGIAGYVYGDPNSVPGLVPLYRAVATGPSLPQRIVGFADLHNHQFANEAFGGKAFVGQPYGRIDEALPHCTPVHGPGGIGDVLGTVKALLDKTGGVGHLVGGFPQFDGWPRWNNLTHQAVYEDWLWRALQGGLKLLVMLAVNNEFAARLVGNQPAAAADMANVDAQLAACRAMEAAIDQRSGGPGRGWYRIVTTPAEARQVIAAGKLAVVLGIEVDFLFDSYPDSPPAPGDLLARLDAYYAQGVRHVFPIHFNDNALGTTAFQNPLVGDPALEELSPAGVTFGIFGWPSEVTTVDGTAQGYTARSGRANIRGLTELGKFLAAALFAKGMIVDVDHMSAAAAADTMVIAQNYDAPVISSHTGFVEISNGDKRHEGNKLPQEVEQIRRSGGMLACILNQGSLAEVNTYQGSHAVVVPHRCGGSSETFVQAYLYAVEKSKGGPVGFGTDFNGMITATGPRFGPDCCHDGGVTTSPPVDYPFRAPATGAILHKSIVVNKIFDINYDGLAHIGLLPDFVADLQALGLTEEDLAPLLNAAEGYIQMWERLERRRQPPPPQPFAGQAPTWAQRGGGFLNSDDGDHIAYWIEPGAVDANEVEFVLELRARLTWRKELVLVADDGEWTIGVQDQNKRDQNGLYRYQLPNGRLRFRKEKGVLAGGMRQVLELAQLDTLPQGARVTFRWVRD